MWSCKFIFYTFRIDFTDFIIIVLLNKREYQKLTGA